MSVAAWCLFVLLGLVVALWGGLWIYSLVSAWRNERKRERLTWRR
jgi:hypothetical protein